MAVLLKALQRAANDFRPKAPPQVIPLITLAHKHQRAFWGTVIALLVLIVVLVGSMFWSIHDAKTVMAVKTVPAPALMPAVKAPKIVVKLEHETTHAKAAPQTPAPPPAEKADAYVDIVLPAESLSVAEAPVPAGDPAISVVAEKISDLPAMSRASHEKNASAISFSPTSALSEDQLLSDARLLLEAGDDQTAIGLYNRVLAGNKTSRAALAGKMYALQRTGQYEDAVETGHALLRLDPEDRAVRANLVTALAQSYAPAAMNELEHMIEANPNDASAHAALAKLLMRRGYLEQAFAQLSRAQQIAPTNIVYRLDLAILYDQAGHTGDALTLYRQALSAMSAQDEPSRLPFSISSIRQRVEYLEGLTAAINPKP